MAKIEFNRLPIPKRYGKVINNIYYVVDNGTITIEEFYDLEEDQKDDIKDLICRMATNENFQSPKIKYTLHQYAYGEIRPKGHRFFFFRKCGNNYVFFGHIEKKSNTKSGEIYKRYERKMNEYEGEFQKFIENN